MPSTFLGLNTAYLGLSASNASLNTTANNISNVETEGYSRQHTVQQASEAMRFFTSFGCVGAGVEVLSVERYRDEFYDNRYWNNQTRLGSYETKEYYMKQIENYFLDDPEQNQEGFSTIFSKLYNSLQEMIKQTGDSSARIQYLGSVSDLTTYFNSMYQNLQAVQKDVNAEIKVQVDQINSLSQKIATLNKQINVIEMGGSNANSLRDERAKLIDDLSEIVSVECEEQKLVDNNNPTLDTGATRYIVKIAGGQTLVDDTVFNTIIATARSLDEKVNQSDAEGLYDLRWSNGSNFSLQSKEIGGKLQGLIEIRDGNNGEYFHGTVNIAGKTVYDTDGDGQNDTNRFGEEIKYTYVKIPAEYDYMKDLNKSTLPDSGGQITIGGARLTYENWELEYDEDTGKHTYTFILSNDNDAQSLLNLVGKEAGIGSKVEYQGVPYYMEQMNEWLRLYAQKNNDLVTQEKSVNNYGQIGEILFTANEAPSSVDPNYNQWNFVDDYYTSDTGAYKYTNGKRVLLKDSGMSYKITSESNSYFRMTAGNVSVNGAMLKDSNLLADHTQNTDEESKQDIAQSLMELRDNLDVMSFRGATAGEFLQCILSDISLNADQANNFSNIYTNIGKTISNQRLSISGVDEDEEALNLVKFQNAYNLSSKMIQILTEVYDKLINETGV